MRIPNAKGRIRLGLVMGLMLLFTHCSKNPQSPAMLKNSNDLNKTSLVGVTGMDLKAKFEELATLLAQRAPRVIEKIMATDKVEATFAELNLDSDLPRQFVTGDGRILETTLERAQPCNVIPQSIDSPIIFAPDPDRFQRDDENHICNGLRIENGKITPVSFTLDEYLANLSTIPLYLVGYQERVQNVNSNTSLVPESSLRKNVGATVGEYYVACHKLHMKLDHDPYSNEECEVYTSSPGVSTYNMTTGLIFSGNERYDAAGRFVFFPDVNNTSTIYTCTQLPAFFRLESQKQGWVAIEDDQTAGTHNRDWHLGGDPPCTYCPIGFQAQVDVQRANGSIIYGTVRDFIYWYSGPINSDDIWQKGCYEEFDLNWSVQLNVDVFYALNHNAFWMQKKQTPF